MQKTAATALLILSICFMMPSVAEALEKIYIHPVVYKTEDVPVEERSYIFEIMHEEMLAYQWLEVLSIDDMGSAASALNKCTETSCILPHLKKAGIPRVVFASIDRLQRRVYQITAKTISAGGKVESSFSMTENGTASEVRYIVPAVIENLFKLEFAKHGNSMAIAMNDEDTVTSTNADESIARAEELIENGQANQAMELFGKAAAMSPNLSLPHRRTAELQLEAKDLAAARQSIESALKSDPADSRSHYIKGRILHASGERAAALKSLEQALKLDAKFAEAYYMSAQILDESGRTKEAIKLFESFKVIRQNDPIIYVNLGKLYLKAKNSLAARDALLRAQNLDASEASLYPPLAESYEELADWHNAATTYNRLAEMLPDCAACHFNHGRVLDQCGRAGEAITAYRRAIEADSSFIDAYYNLGIDCHEIGRQEEARASLLKYIELESRQEQAAFVKKACSLIDSM